MPSHSRSNKIECVKTGALLFLREYGMYARGDAFKLKSIYLFRLTTNSYARILPPEHHHLHYEVRKISIWWDEQAKYISTLIVDASNLEYFGYGGKELTFNKEEKEKTTRNNTPE